MRKLKKVAVGITTAGLVVAGGIATTVAVAGPAAAVGSSACTGDGSGLGTAKTTTGINLRNGPSTSYAILGFLGKGTKIDPECTDGSWLYGKVLTGANAGTWGWVSIPYLDPA
ncbi:SH3 domain-containing protein [Streptomyces sp. NPDC056373]|uniref:SH3 domain-containing protein n=1 Tax=Streptomyces sp. NPDC056373 TaxID=3345798 RepID=UPI0035DB5327